MQETHAYRQIDKQTDRQTDGQTEEAKHIYKKYGFVIFSQGKIPENRSEMAKLARSLPVGLED